MSEAGLESDFRLRCVEALDGRGFNQALRIKRLDSAHEASHQIISDYQTSPSRVAHEAYFAISCGAVSLSLVKSNAVYEIFWLGTFMLHCRPCRSSRLCTLMNLPFGAKTSHCSLIISIRRFDNTTSTPRWFVRERTRDAKDLSDEIKIRSLAMQGRRASRTSLLSKSSTVAKI